MRRQLVIPPDAITTGPKEIADLLRFSLGRARIGDEDV
jgi:hypothetical protein